MGRLHLLGISSNSCCKDMSEEWRKVRNLIKSLELEGGGIIYKVLYNEEMAIVHTC